MKRRNKFSLSHFKLLTGKMGYLYPIACVETLPGDTFQMATSVFLRFSPLVAPVMTPVVVKIHHWFVPTRLIWDDFEDFITGGPQGTSVPTPPFLDRSSNIPVGSLSDYFGIPAGDYQVAPGTTGSGYLRHSTLPIRAYNLIYKEWYRDQNLDVNGPINSTESGNDYVDGQSRINLTLLKSPWDKDYFTTAAPWEQKGVAVSVPVSGSPSGTINITGNGIPTFRQGTATGPLFVQGEYTEGGNVPAKFRPAGDAGGVVGNLYWSDPKLSATFTGSASLGSIDLNQFREAMAMQRFEEHRALYGSRYVEYLRYLGVKASDARLQRPEYLGGGRSVIQFSEVLQTAEDGDTPVGTMRGHGIGAMRTNRFRRFFEEHGYVISLLSIRPKAFYMQGLPRMFSRFIKTDYWQKELEHIGQQEVYNRELYAFGAERDNVFGYSDRYNEYRTHPSYVCGEFRDLLNYWHLGRDFNETPVLNTEFIRSLPTDRVFADRTGNDTIYMMVNNSIQARRLVSKHGTPR